MNLLRLFVRSRNNRALVERLYGALVAQSRLPVLFRDFCVPDTVEGRFEVLSLHVILVSRRLRAMDAPGPDLAQDLVDTVFRYFDGALRELGVGDVTMPKRMKTMAAAFLGRAKAYEDALQSGERNAVRDAIIRNMLFGEDGNMAQAEQLTDYVLMSVSALSQADFNRIVVADLPFIDPETQLKETKK